MKEKMTLEIGKGDKGDGARTRELLTKEEKEWKEAEG